MRNGIRIQLAVAVLLVSACSGNGEADTSAVDVVADGPQKMADQSTPPVDLDTQASDESSTVDVGVDQAPDLPHGDEDLAEELVDLAPEHVDIAPEQVDIAPELVDIAPELVDLASELVDIAPELPPVCAAGEPCDDGDSCTWDDQCDGEGGCAGEPMDCDDGEPCTDGDTCFDGDCVAGVFICECLADEDCAEQEDGDLCNGTLVCNHGELPYLCVIDPGTISTCFAQEPQECNLWGCLPESGECILIPHADGTACDDLNPCSTQDVCQAGSCMGQPLPVFCQVGETYCVGESVCLCDECGNGCQEVLKVCQPPAFNCQEGDCVACQPDCDPGQCGDDGCGGSCGTCPGISTCNPDGECVCECPDWGDPVCDPLTGTVYVNECLAACQGVETTEPGACGSVCYTVEGAVPAEVGQPIAAFFCKDLNMNSPGLGGAVSNVTLNETIWIAYFGACT